MGPKTKGKQTMSGAMSGASILFVTTLLIISALPLLGSSGSWSGEEATMEAGQAAGATDVEEGLSPAEAPPTGVLTRDGRFNIDDLLEYMAGYGDAGTGDVPRSGTPFFYSIDLMGPGLSPDFRPPSVTFTDDGGGASTQGASSRATWVEKYDGTHCDINLETDGASFVSQSAINNLGNEFDTLIHPTDSALFDKNGNVQHIEINIYRFGDGGGGVGGYFSGQYPNYVFIDADDMFWADEILAHEFQHLIHFDEDPWEELWINEGCSDFAIFACYGIGAGSLQSHLYYFTQYPDDDLTQWGQSIVDYGQAVAFIIYLWEHYGGDEFITDLVDSLSHGTTGVTNTISRHGGTDDFQDAFRNWATANHMDDTDIDEGQYGYVSMNIEMKLSATHSNYPVQGSGSVQGWASDYIRFTSGDDDLTINFDGSSSDTYMVNILQFASGLASNKVVEMDLGSSSQDGEIIITGFGTTYADIVMSVMSASGQASYNYEVILGDITPPVTSAIVSPDDSNGEDGWYVTRPSVTMQADENGATIYYRIGDGEEATYTGEFELPDGEYDLHFHAVDDSDNIEVSRYLEFKVDTQMPTTGLVTDPAGPDGTDGWFVTMPEIELEVDEPGAGTWYRWDDSTDWYNYGARISGREGEHVLEFYSKDKAGNTEKVQVVDFLVDTVVPTTTLTVNPPQPDGNQSWYRVPVTASFDVEGEEDEFMTYYAFDESDGDYTLYEGGEVVIPEGQHTLYYHSADIAGNTEPVMFWEFKLDTVAPTVNHSIDSDEDPNEEGWYHTSVKVYLESINGSTILYAIDDEDDFDYYSIGVRMPEGASIFYYYAVDEAGNAADIAELELKVDTETPSTDITVTPRRAQKSGWYHESPYVELESSEEEATIYYRLIQKDDGRRGGEEDYSAYRRAIEISEGRWTLSYYTMDPAGNTERAWEQEFDVDLRAPKAVLEASALTVYVDDPVTFTAVNSSDTMGLESYAFDFDDGTGVYTEGQRHAGDGSSDAATTHTFATSGTYNVTLVVEDISGRESPPVHLTVTVKNVPSDDNGGGGTFGGALGGDSGTAIILLVIIIAVVVILTAVIIAAVVHSRRKKEARRQAMARRRAHQAELVPPAKGAAATGTAAPMPAGPGLPAGGPGTPGGPVPTGALEGQEEMKLLPPPPSPEGGDGGGGEVPATEELSEDEKAALQAEEEALGPSLEENPVDGPIGSGEAGPGVLPEESRPRPPPRGRSRRSGAAPGFRAKGSDVSSGSDPSANGVPEVSRRSMKPVGPPGVVRKEPPVEAAPEVGGPDEDDELFDL